MFRRLLAVAALGCAVLFSTACVPAGLTLAAAPAEPIAVAAASVQRDQVRAPVPAAVSFSIPFPAFSAPSPAPAAAPIVVDPTPVQVNVAPSEPAPVHVTVAPTAVTFSWGDWATELAQIAASIAAPLGLFLLGLVKGMPGVVLRAYLTEKKINELAGYAVNAVAGASKDRALSIDVGNQVLATGLQYAVDTFPRGTIKMLGGPDGIRSKLLGVLHLDSDASAETVNGYTPA